LGKRLLLAAIVVSVLISNGAYGDLKIANDPAQVGVGARSLGMGGVSLNFTDISSLFGNPAALSKIKSTQYTFMHGKFINEVDYISVGGVIPSDWGNFGVAFLNSQLSYTGPVATTEVKDGIRIIPSTTEVSTDIYRNTAVYLSFCKPAKEIIENEYLDKMYLGGTLKIFSQELSAPGISGTAQGYEMDLGMQYWYSPWLRFSLLGKNVLPASMGGKLTWQPTGREEGYPYFIKAGVQADVGERGTPFELENQTVSLAVEYDYRPRGIAPNILHYGLEWGLGEILDIRLGRDQGYIGEGGTSLFDVANNLTYGVGVTYMGWRFDYAFHEYYDDSENTTSYFSLTYGLPYAEEKEPFERVVFVPQDKSIVDQASIKLSGKIVDRGIAYVYVEEEYMEEEGGKISGEFELELGKNQLQVLGIDRNRKEVYEGKLRFLRLIGFQDVGEDFWAKDAIQILATLGMIKGYPGDVFKPENGITRAEFATLLARLAGESKYEVKKELPFRDLASDHWAYSAAAYALDNDLIKGYPDGTFKPNKKITRAEGVVVIARFAGLDVEAPVDVLPFDDVPGRHWAVKAVNAAKLAGLLEYLEYRFEPNAGLTRAETAEILSKVGSIKNKIDELLDFEKGYE
jgi:hypothetical protein